MNVYRFAPSPTGFLHIGGARTAIFNWLSARKENGKFILRIEDTDRNRSSDKYTKQILSSLKWLGLDWDENPVFQSERENRHIEIANKLLKCKKAYHCFCTPEELAENRKIAEKNKTEYIYDGKCRNLTDSAVQQKIDAGIPYSVRLKTDHTNVQVTDKVLGNVTFAVKEFGDFIILRSNGTPVYQLAVVVDDHDMCVTEVVRGADHLSNTPKQILLYEALGWSIPNFVHLPLILGPDKKRLSKRHGSTSVEEFRDKGYLPDALFNYLCLLGLSTGSDSEIFSKDNLIKEFNLDNVNNSNAVFDEKKLIWMNAKYISQKSAEELLNLSKEYNARENELEDIQKHSAQQLAELVKLRAETIVDFDQRMNFFYSSPQQFNEKGEKKYFNQDTSAQLQLVCDKLDPIDDFIPAMIEHVIRNLADELQISAGNLIHPLRLALTGDIASPGIFEIISILGKSEANKRIKNAIEYIHKLKLE